MPAATAAATIIATRWRARSGVWTRWSRIGVTRGRCRGIEGGVGCLIVGVGLGVLVTEKQIAGVDECGKGRQRRQEGLQNPKLGIEPANHLMDQGAIGDGLITIGQGVGELLQAMAVVVGRKIALLKAMQLSL